jgi:pSer/pThr/pTyr-binding forkhead associated (FHA) protein
VRQVDDGASSSGTMIEGSMVLAVSRHEDIDTHRFGDR